MTSHFCIQNIGAILMIVLGAHISSAQTPGSLDESFGDGGTVITEFGVQYDVAQGLVIQPDGKIVLSGTAKTLEDGVINLVLVRFLEDGSLDNSFGDAGIASVDLGITQFVEQSDPLALQEDGKLVTVLHKKNGDYYDFAAVRFNTDGTPDNTFGVDGIAEISMYSEDDFPTAVAIQSDGKILVWGHGEFGSYYELGLVRFNADGTLDGSFNSTGIWMHDFGFGDNTPSDMEVQPDGKILLLAYCDFDPPTYTNVVVIRLNADGSYDASFGDGGIAVHSLGDGYDYALAFFLKDDGKIMVTGSRSEPAGDDNQNPYVLRLNSDGTADNTFDGDGLVDIDMGEESDWGRSITEQSDGKILIGGYDSHDGIIECSLMQLDEDGSLDNTFGTGGISLVSAGSDSYHGEIVRIQPDNKIVIAGWISDGGSPNFEWAASRFNSSLGVGIENFVASTSVNIYPNPAINIIYLEITETDLLTNDLKIQITDIYNRIISEQKMADLKSQIDIASLSAGLYFLKLISGDKIITTSFQKIN